MRLQALLLALLLMLTTLPAPCAADAAAEAQDAARQGRVDGRADGEREGRERGETDGFQAGRRQGFDDMVERLALDRGELEGRERGERAANDEGTQRGRAEGEQSGTRDGEAEGRARAERESEAPARGQGTNEADRSDARTVGTRDGTAEGQQDALSRARKVDETRGHEQYRTERWHLPPRTRKTWTVPRSGAAPLDGATASRDGLAGVVAWDSDGRVPAPDRRYWRAAPPYPEPHRAHAYASTYAGGYQDGFRDAYRNAWASARGRGRDTGASDARYTSLSSLTGNQIWRRAFDQAMSAAYRRSYDALFPGIFERCRKSAYDETFARVAQLTRDQAYPAAFERHRQSAYESRYNDLYGTAFKTAHDARYAALYPILAKQLYAKGREDEMQAFQQRPFRIAYVAVRDDGDGVVQPGETVRLDVVLRSFSGKAVAPGKLGLSVTARPLDALTGAERRPALPQGLAAGEELTLVDLVRLRAAPNAVGKSCVLDVRLTLSGREMDALTQDLTVQWPVAVKLETVPLVEGLPNRWTLSFENVGRKPVSSLQVRVGTTAGALSLPSTVLPVAGLAPGARTSLPIEVTGWKTRDSAPATVSVDVTGDGRLLSQTTTPVTTEVQTPCVLDYVGGKLRLRDAGEWKVDFRLSGPSDSGPLVLEAAPDAESPTPVEVIGVESGTNGACSVRLRISQANTGGRFLLRVRGRDGVLMRRRIDF